MKTTKIAVLCLLSCILSACLKQSEEYITLVNKSGRDIVFQTENEKYFTNTDVPFQCQGIVFTILKDSLFLLHSVDDTGWEADFNFRPCMIFLLMDKENYHQYRNEPCDTIRKYVPILHRYRVSLEDMEQMNWTVVYPPE